MLTTFFLLKILIKFSNFFRHNFIVFTGDDAITNMIMTRKFYELKNPSRIRIRNPKIKNSDPNPDPE